MSLKEAGVVNGDPMSVDEPWPELDDTFQQDEDQPADQEEGVS